MHPHRLRLSLCLLTFCATQTRALCCPQEGVPDAHARYLELCARCHGPEGAGDGTAELPHPARSFTDGGFSYGNTRAAILRTITFGIPGTPMPSHAGAIPEIELAALADYVISLGPERKVVSVSETILPVTDRALIVRGFLPPIIEGAPQRTRGLLLGLTSGASFEYRVDDVRFIAVRQGDFVQRRDWTARGGKPLLPLGRPTLICAKGDPRPGFVVVREPQGGVEREPLHAKLKRTWTAGQRAGLVYWLEGENGAVMAKVHEEPRVADTSAGAGFVRALRLEAGAAACVLEFNTSYLTQDCGGPTGILESRGDTQRAHASSRLQNDGLQRLVVLRGPTSMRVRAQGLQLTLAPGQTAELEVLMVTALDSGEDTLPSLLEQTR